MPGLAKDHVHMRVFQCTTMYKIYMHSVCGYLWKAVQVFPDYQQHHQQQWACVAV